MSDTPETPGPVGLPPLPQKLTANRDLPLSLYAYIVRPGNVIVPVMQMVELIFAFTEDEAVQTLLQKYAPPAGNHDPNHVVSYDAKGKIPAVNLLQLIDRHDAGKTGEIVKTKADYYIELMADLRKVARDFYPDATQQTEYNQFESILSKLEEVVKESKLFQQL